MTGSPRLERDRGSAVTTPVLELEAVSRAYGSVRAVDGVSLTVPAGSRHAVIGPNGAGKSTLFSLVAGTVRPTSGRVRVLGADVTGLPDHRRARLGVAKTFQHSSLFGAMTALDNVRLAAARRHGRPARPTGRYGPAVTGAARDALERVGLGGRDEVAAADLSHGERRQLELAVVLALQPRLLLLDEPTAGMSAAETERFVALVGALPADLTVLMIEHDLDVVLSLADAVTVLHLGQVAASGTPAQIRASELVQQVYLGTWQAGEPGAPKPAPAAPGEPA